MKALLPGIYSSHKSPTDHVCDMNAVAMSGTEVRGLTASKLCSVLDALHCVDVRRHGGSDVIKSV